MIDESENGHPGKLSPVEIAKAASDYLRGTIAEELRETEQAVASGDAAAIEEELGDVLFAVANWARLLKIDPETALRAANRKFERRFAAMEALIAARGWQATELSAAQWDELWVSVKAAE